MRLFSRLSSALCKHQQGSLTTTSARLCHHLPRVYQLHARIQRNIGFGSPCVGRIAIALHDIGFSAFLCTEFSLSTWADFLRSNKSNCDDSGRFITPLNVENCDLIRENPCVDVCIIDGICHSDSLPGMRAAMHVACLASNRRHAPRDNAFVVTPSTSLAQILSLPGWLL